MQRRARDHQVLAARDLGIERRRAELLAVDAHDRPGRPRRDVDALDRGRRCAQHGDRVDHIGRELGQRDRPRRIEREREREHRGSVGDPAVLHHRAEPQRRVGIELGATRQRDQRLGLASRRGEPVLGKVDLDPQERAPAVVDHLADAAKLRQRCHRHRAGRQRRARIADRIAHHAAGRPARRDRLADRRGERRAVLAAACRDHADAIAVRRARRDDHGQRGRHRRAPRRPLGCRGSPRHAIARAAERSGPEAGPLRSMTRGRGRGQHGTARGSILAVCPFPGSCARRRAPMVPGGERRWRPPSWRVARACCSGSASPRPTRRAG
jgi:hypothetical protein